MIAIRLCVSRYLNATFENRPYNITIPFIDGFNAGHFFRFIFQRIIMYSLGGFLSYGHRSLYY